MENIYLVQFYKPGQSRRGNIQFITDASGLSIFRRKMG